MKWLPVLTFLTNSQKEHGLERHNSIFLLLRHYYKYISWAGKQTTSKCGVFGGLSHQQRNTINSGAVTLRGFTQGRVSRGPLIPHSRNKLSSYPRIHTHSTLQSDQNGNNGWLITTNLFSALKKHKRQVSIIKCDNYMLLWLVKLVRKSYF